MHLQEMSRWGVCNLANDICAQSRSPFPFVSICEELNGMFSLIRRMCALWVCSCGEDNDGSIIFQCPVNGLDISRQPLASNSLDI